MSIYGNITNNLAAVFPARWYPTEGDREHYLDVNVELVGTIDRRTGYPIQNLRASTKGTVVRVGQSFPVKERQEVAFLGLWWLVDEVQYDLRERARGGIGECMDIGFLFGWAKEQGVDPRPKQTGA